MHMTRNSIAAAIGCAGLLAHGTPGLCESYPTRAVHVIVPFAPGGASDFVARIVFAKFGEVTGQQAVIDNRPGAGGNIAMEVAAGAPADGLTVFFGNVGTIAINPWLYSTLYVVPVRDFTAVTRVAGIPGVMVTHPSFPVKTLGELIALAKRSPGSVSYGSPGQGSGHRILMELLKKQAGIEIVEVPYKGGAGPAVNGVVGGETEVAFATTASVLQFIKAGRLRPIATMTEKRLVVLPQTPTLPELGYTALVDSQWQGLFVAKATPASIVDRLNAVTNQLLSLTEVRNRLAQGNAEPIATTAPAEFARFVDSESSRWGAIVKSVGAKVD